MTLAARMRVLMVWAPVVLVHMAYLTAFISVVFLQKRKRPGVLNDASIIGMYPVMLCVVALVLNGATVYLAVIGHAREAPYTAGLALLFLLLMVMRLASRRGMPAIAAAKDDQAGKTDEIDLQHLRLRGVSRNGGFAAETIPAGAEGRVIVELFVHSGQPDFHEFVDQLASIYLPGLFVDGVCMFLVLHHEDKSADVYINRFPVTVEMLAKRDISAGERVSLSDIADVRRLLFPDISVDPRDNIVFCFKRGWKFGLYFNFRQANPEERLDVNALELTLGQCFKHLSFQEVYSVIEQDALFGQLREDGWFPFVQLIPDSFRQLAHIYSEGREAVREELLEAFLAEFDLGRIRDISSRWWRLPLFAGQKEILEAGIRAYERGDQEGYITCIKIAHSEIDGILRKAYVAETGQRGRYSKYVKHVHQKAQGKFSTPASLGFPDEFSGYLNDVFLRNVDSLDANPEFSRHSSLHGVAKPVDYSRARALQSILILDQLYFVLQDRTAETDGN